MKRTFHLGVFTHSPHTHTNTNTHKHARTHTHTHTHTHNYNHCSSWGVRKDKQCSPEIIPEIGPIDKSVSVCLCLSLSMPPLPVSLPPCLPLSPRLTPTAHPEP
jgi:hypothetical protein